MTKVNPDDARCKIADFGLSHWALKAHEKGKRTTQDVWEMAPFYWAPEQIGTERNWTSKIDVWT